ncbi:hypothetical protein GGI11_009238, partial [Coemansia sp. RSA 2049]
GREFTTFCTRDTRICARSADGARRQMLPDRRQCASIWTCTLGATCARRTTVCVGRRRAGGLLPKAAGRPA